MVSDITRTCLHVGCGQAGEEAVHHLFRGDDWRHVRLDIDRSVNPDIVADIRTLEGVADESVDGIFSSHNLEHLQFAEVFIALQAFRRVLKDRGRLVIVVPDFELACRWVAEGKALETIYESPAGPITPFDMIYGYRPYVAVNPYMQHKTGFSSKSLQSVLIDQGFSAVETFTTHGYDIWAHARKIA